MFVFYSFGALFFYEMTQSIAAALFLGFLYFAVGIISRSVTVPLFLQIKNKIKVVPFMGIGLTIVALMNLALFIIGSLTPVSAAALAIALVVSSFGSGMYWLFSNIIKLTNIGHAKAPAAYSSLLIIVRMLAAIVATLLGIMLSFNDHFIVLLFFSAVLLFFSLIPLARMKGINHHGSFHLRKLFRHQSRLALLANTKIAPEIFNYGFPIFFVSTFHSVPKSVLITGFSYVIAIVLAYLIGKFKDHHDNRLIMACSILLVLGFIIFTQVHSIIGFIIVISLMGVCHNAIAVGADMRIGKEIVASRNTVEFMAGIEVVRNFGSAISILIFLSIFLLAGYFPQWIFAFGALFIIPEVLYAVGERRTK